MVCSSIENRDVTGESVEEAGGAGRSLEETGGAGRSLEEAGGAVRSLEEAIEGSRENVRRWRHRPSPVGPWAQNPVGVPGS